MKTAANLIPLEHFFSSCAAIRYLKRATTTRPVEVTKPMKRYALAALLIVNSHLEAFYFSSDSLAPGDAVLSSPGTAPSAPWRDPGLAPRFAVG